MCWDGFEVLLFEVEEVDVVDDVGWLIFVVDFGGIC